MKIDSQNQMIDKTVMNEQRVDLKDIIQLRFSEISQRNPKFSLRAFAKKLKMSPSHLSRVLRGQKKVSYQLGLRLVQELDLSFDQSNAILNDLKILDHKNVEERSVQVLDFEIFRLISNWYHFPLLELIKTKDFNPDQDWIAKRLNIPVPVVAQALERLEKLHLIRRTKRQILLTQGEMYKTSDDIQNRAIKKHHAQMLEKAITALEEQEVKEREYQSLNLNFNKKDLVEAKNEIRKFVKKFNKKFAKTQGEDVYQLNIQLFSLTKEIK